jgi:hypothetical protein
MLAEKRWSQAGQLYSIAQIIVRVTKESGWFAGSAQVSSP